MRCKRMRGYGSWCIGWNEAKNKPYEPNNNTGCGIVGLGLFFILLAICFVKASIDTGSPLGVLLAISVLTGFVKGLNNN